MATINGTDGDDQFEQNLQDLAGNDTLNGLKGNDWFRMLVGGTDTVNGGDGDDAVFYEEYTTKLVINLRDGFVSDTLGNTDTLNSVEGANSGKGSDEITFGDDGGYVFARAGDDTIHFGANGNFALGGSGDDHFIGGAGFDTVSYEDDGLNYDFDVDGGGLITHGATVDLAAGTATDGWGDHDTLSGIEAVVGSQFADKITGNSGSNNLEGGGGKDTIEGGGTATVEDWDNVNGGEGNDTLTVEGAGSIEGGQGNDRIIGVTSGDEDIDYVVASFYEAEEAVVANLTAKKHAGLAGGSNSKGFLVNDGQGGIDKVSGIHALDDTKFGDTVIVDGSLKNSYGNSFTVQLGAGNDYVKFIGVDDGEVDYGKAEGGVFADLGAGFVTDADEEDNFIGYDRLIGVNVLKASNFADEVNGSDGVERIRGRGGSDTINGNGGNDNLFGDERSVTQRDGKDTINGGKGKDTLTGGGAADKFVFDAELSEKSNIDTITDFGTGDDRIVLDREIFSELGKSGKLSGKLFKDLGDKDAKLDKDDRILYNHKTGELSYDADGSKTKFDAVQFAQLDNKFDLAASDFLVV